MTIPNEVLSLAGSAGFDDVRAIRLIGGETVYLLLLNDGGKVGLPTYVHYVDGTLAISTAKESLALLDDPSFRGL